MNGSSWLLGGGYSWRSAEPAGDPGTPRSSAVVDNPEAGLSLPTLENGPLGLDSPDGSLGGLALPRGVAVSGETVLVLSTAGDLVYRYEPAKPAMVPLAQVGAEGLPAPPPRGWERESRRFRGATGIAVSGGALYVACPAAEDEGGGRVQVFDLDSLALLRIHRVDVADLAAGRRGVYIADRRGAVYRAKSRRDGLRRLAAPPAEPRLVRRIAVDRDERVYLLEGRGDPPDARSVLRLGYPLPAGAAAPREFSDSGLVRDRFDKPAVGTGDGDVLDLGPLADPCGLRRSDPLEVRRAIGSVVYVLDPVRREARVHLPDGRLRSRFGPLGPDGSGTAADAPSAWNPVDFAAAGDCVLILDGRHRAVYAHARGSDALARWFAAPEESAMAWRRIALDDRGCVLLWDGSGPRVERYSQGGESRGTLEAREARRFFRREPPPPEAASPTLVTRDGLVKGGPGRGPRLRLPSHKAAGRFVTTWLDSGIYNCQWHVIELSLSNLPAGSRVAVRTRTSNTAESDAAVLAALRGIEGLGSWRGAAAIAGPAQPGGAPPAKSADVLVQSGPGQYLQLLIELEGDRFDTPVIGSARLRFPRESLLEYLPAVYSAPEEQREFLDRFLAVFQTSWDAIEREAGTFGRYLDPDAVPPEGMPFLARLLALRLEGTWTDEQNRRLLQAMPRLVAIWGTPSGLREWLRVYLSVLSGLELSAIPLTLPGIVERFVERRRLMLGRLDTATLGAAAPLWSPAVEGRLQLGEFDREGDVSLVSHGDPPVDVFRHHAHSFRVYIPAAWVRSPDEEALLRRAIELQRPAHTTYELVLVEPRFRVGVQSTLDLDTVISAPHEGTLGCPRRADAPSRPAHQRLGFDTVLGSGSDPSALGRADLILA